MKPSHRTYLILAAFALLLTALVLLMRPKNQDSKLSRESAAKRENHTNLAVSPVQEVSPTAVESAPKPEVAASETPATTTGPEKTRSARRDEVVTSSGKRKTVVDPMASWTDTPPWPEGPKMFAEVESSSRRYVNLRPDDIGEMPRVRAEANERLELKVTFSEGEPGEKIHVEIPNGGAFTDSEARGRIYVLPENRTLSFAYLADDSRGHCNVKFLHRGHTRSLPIWVGELPAPAIADSETY